MQVIGIYYLKDGDSNRNLIKKEIFLDLINIFVDYMRHFR